MKTIEQQLKLDGLTEREIETMSWVLQGFTNKEIGDKMCITYQGPRFHISNILKKTKLKNRKELMKRYLNLGIPFTIENKIIQFVAPVVLPVGIVS